VKELLDLAFGSSVANCNGAYGDAVRALHASATKTMRRLEQCIGSDDEDFLIDFGPFIGRRMTEELMGILQGRIDPTRLIVSHKGANGPDFLMGSPNRSSLSWSDDVFPGFEIAKEGVWSQSTLKKNSGIVRGLLSGHLAYSLFDHGFIPALDAAQREVDEVTRTGADLPAWIEAFQKFSEGEHLLSDLRRRASDAYSRLSKGIHFEFIPSSGAALSSLEIKRLLFEIIFVLSTISYVVNCSGLAHCSLTPSDSIKIYFSLSSKFSN